MEKENKKKNKIFRLVYLLLIFTLISLCLMSGTLAKYITSDSVSNSARVAKWGVVISTTGSDLFKTTYATDDSTYSSTITNSVSASVNVVAPGTSGSAGGFTITGTPEVACLIEVSIDSTLSKLEYWTLGVGSAGTAYEPIVWSLNGAKCGTNGTFAELLAALNNVSVAVPPGTNLATALTGSNSWLISWEWDFDDSGAGTNDVNDTYLGNKTNAPTITLVYDITVTQID